MMKTQAVSLLSSQAPSYCPLLTSAVADMQLREITEAFISDGSLRAAVLHELTAFCTDADSVKRRRALLGDMLSFPEVRAAAEKLLPMLEETEHINSMTFYGLLPGMSELKTFLLARSYAVFAQTASSLTAEWAERLSFSDELRRLALYINAPESRSVITELLQASEPLNKRLDSLRKIRVNRFYSRGQNTENSVLPGETGLNLTSFLLGVADKLGLPLSFPSEKREDEPSPQLCEALINTDTALFEALASFNGAHREFFDPSRLGLIYEMRVLLGFCSMYGSFISRGFPVTPVSCSDYSAVTGMYSPLLACRGLDPASQVANDVAFDRNNRTFTVTGPNGGGKTVFISAVGVNWLFFQASGFMLAEHAEAEVMKGLFTHFPSVETSDSGRLFKEKEATSALCAAAPEGSLVLLNETYSGTKTETAVALGKELFDLLKKKRAAVFYVTHFHELKTAEGIIPLTALADAENNGSRLFRIVPESTQKGSFAKSILLKHRMTENALFRRIDSTRTRRVEGSKEA